MCIDIVNICIYIYICIFTAQKLIAISLFSKITSNFTGPGP